MKKWNFIIATILLITMLFGGCAPTSVEEAGTPNGLPTFQMVFPAQADLIGNWTIDTVYTKAFTGKDMQELYGTSFGTYGCGMEFGRDGSLSYFIAAGTGGEGTYTVSESEKYVTAILTDYQTGQQTESVIRAAYINAELRLLKEEGKELLVWKKETASAANTDTVPTPVLTPTPTPTVAPTPTPTASPEWQIAGFPLVYQNPELPTGCEITALTMILNYYEFDVDKMTMANKYLPTTEIGTWEKDGVTYGPDLYNYFAGDPAGTGITCGAGAIEAAADAYLQKTGSDLRAEDISGTPAHELYAYVSQNIPVFLCATIGMEDRRSTKEAWYTKAGELMDWSTNDHGVVLIGYTKTEVTVADPINGRVTCTREQFERVYEQRGRQAVVLVANP